jgi:uncharacterized membrane protein YqiK
MALLFIDLLIAFVVVFCVVFALIWIWRGLLIAARSMLLLFRRKSRPSGGTAGEDAEK